MSSMFAARIARSLRRAGVFLKQLDPLRVALFGYASYVVLGWLVLCMPICHQAPGLRILDHLFTSASAVSTTGLVTISTSDSYSWLGEFVVLMLIQFGGLGYMTISSFVILAVTGDLSLGRKRVSETVISLPTGGSILDFLRLVVKFTLIIEALGAVALLPSFVSHGAPQPVWQAVFHSVSAFCTAGFGLFNNSLEDYRDDNWMNFVVTLLSYLGAIGFIVLNDAWASARDRKRTITLTSKAILWCTFWIGAVGTVLFALDEPTLQGLTLFARWRAALFQVMTASTTVGFNTIPIGAIGASSLFLLTIVMIIGASPSGTGGGLKTTTFTALWAEMVSVVRRREFTTFAGRTIPRPRLRAAAANVMFYFLTLSAGIYLLSLFETAPLPDQMFECASALGTVGLSRGITGSLTSTGKVILIALMFVGRLGPVVIGMSLFGRPRGRIELLEEDVVV